MRFKKTQALNVSYNSDFFDSLHHKTNRLKTSAELVQKMIACIPEREQILTEINDKPRILLTYDDLIDEADLLREKLKAVNKNLDRIVKKEIVSN